MTMDVMFVNSAIDKNTTEATSNVEKDQNADRLVARVVRDPSENRRLLQGSHTRRRSSSRIRSGSSSIEEGGKAAADPTASG